MAHHSKNSACFYRLSYEADSGRLPDGEVLACIRYGSATPVSPDPREVQVPLPPLGAPPRLELWRSLRPVEHGWADGFGYAHNGEVLFGQLRLEAPAIAALADATALAYSRMHRLLLRLGYPSCLRIWNFLGHINVGEDDAERYRQFSKGRYHALANVPDFEALLPAATAIGTPDDGLTVCFLAARGFGAPVENPRQVSAYRYPPAYGPKSPSFSRAYLKPWADQTHLFVSGTASVVGHASLHGGNAMAQLEETHHNIEALLQQARAAHPAGSPFRALGLKLYIRSGQDAPALIARAQQLFGADTPLLGLCGDICRRELLLEMEGVFSTPHPGAAPCLST